MAYFRNQKGDTIIEVLISITVLSLILTSCYALANRSSQAVRQAQERSEALKINEAQQEQLKTYLSDPGHAVPTFSSFCMKSGVVIDATAQPNDCTAGTEDTAGTGRYRTTISVVNGAYVANTTWDKVSGSGQDSLKVAYKVYLASATNIDLTQDPTDDVQDSCPLLGQQLYNGVCGFACSNGIDDDGDEVALGLLEGTRRDFSDDPGCINANGTNEEGIPDGNISGDGYFGTWHLRAVPFSQTYIAGWNTRTFTMTNTSADGWLRGLSASIGGTNSSSFRISANDCATKVNVGPGSSCTVTLEFMPSSGGANNRLANAGLKQATLTISSSNEVTKTTSIFGKAYTDQAGPGDIITDTTQEYFRIYHRIYYNNVFAYTSPVTGLQTNGNLSLNGKYCYWGGGGTPGFGNYPWGQDKHRLVMQTDGNLVFYGTPPPSPWSSGTQGRTDVWYRIQYRNPPPTGSTTYTDYSTATYLAQGSDANAFMEIGC